jgi:hypothetical protein
LPIEVKESDERANKSEADHGIIDFTHQKEIDAEYKEGNYPYATGQSI